MSGGIHDVYYTDISKYLSTRAQMISTFARQTAQILLEQYKALELFLPNVDELFFIIRHALKCKNLVGTHSGNVLEIFVTQS